MNLTFFKLILYFSSKILNENSSKTAVRGNHKIINFWLFLFHIWKKNRQKLFWRHVLIRTKFVHFEIPIIIKRYAKSVWLQLVWSVYGFSTAFAALVNISKFSSCLFSIGWITSKPKSAKKIFRFGTGSLWNRDRASRLKTFTIFPNE